MKNSKQLAEECKNIYESLEKTASILSLTYTISLFISIAIGILLLGGFISNKYLNFVIGSVGLLATLLPLVFKKNMEKIHGYLDLSIEFKNLEQDFLNSKLPHQKKSEDMKMLRKKLSDYPVKGFSKWI